MGPGRFRAYCKGENVAETTIALPDGARIVVVGGGPAGAFFAIHALRRARELGKKLDVLILERKRELNFYQPALLSVAWEGCNYCAGGISPRLADALRASDLSLPPDIVEGSATAITVHGDWKSVELPIPEGRKMLSVFRGSRPREPPRPVHELRFVLARPGSRRRRQDHRGRSPRRPLFAAAASP